MRSGRWGPLPPSKPPPARHRPGARSARRDGRCRHSLADRLQKEIVNYVAFLDPELPEYEPESCSAETGRGSADPGSAGEPVSAQCRATDPSAHGSPGERFLREE